MNPKSKSQYGLPLAAILAASASLHAAPVIYEPFAYAAGGLNGQGGTSDFGFTAVWSASADSKVVATNLQYGALATTGGSIGGMGGSINRFGGARPCATALAAPTNLLADGTTLWFSVIVGYEAGANNTRLGFALANSSFNTGNFKYWINNEGAQLGRGVGFSLSGNTNGVVNASLFRDLASGDNIAGIVNGNTSGTIVSNGNPPRLLVGSIAWGAGLNDVITIYAPNSSLALGTAISTLTVDVDQSTFDTFTWARGDKIMMDEVRFGASSADVMPLDTVAPTLLPVNITDNMAGGPIGEDVAEVTYTLTFDRPMDISTITDADFANAGSATATVGTPTQVSPNVVAVKLVPTTTGTLQLRIPATSVLSSYVPLNLDTTSAILDDTTITISGTTTDPNIPTANRWWDGTTVTGITNGASGGGNGTWDNGTTTNWDRGAGFEAPVAWNNANNNTAIFSGTAGTVTIGAPVTAAGITSSVNYTLQSNALTLDVASGTPVVNVTANTLTITSDIAGTKGLQKTGAGSLLLAGNKSFSGGLTMSAGTLQVNDASDVFGTGTLTVGGGQIRANVNGQVSTTINNQIWNGSFQLSRGATGSATWNFEGDISLGANVTVTHADNTVNTNLIGDISDGGNNRLLTLAGSNGFFNLSGNNTHGGGTTLSAGTLRINSSSAIGTGTFTISGGTIDNTTANSITLSTNNAVTFGADFTFGGTKNLTFGNGAITNAGSRTITLNGTESTLAFGGVMTNTANAVQTTTVNGAGNTLVLGGYALSNNATSRINVITGTGNVRIAGAVSNGGTATASGLTKSGAGTLTLEGTNTYKGNTTVSAGTLAVTGSLGTSAVTVSAGTLSGNGNFGANVTIASGATHSIAVAATAAAQDTSAITGTLAMAGSILNLTAASTPAAGEYVLATATVAITGTPTTINYNGITGTVSVDSDSTPKRLLLTVSGGPTSPFETWANGTFANGTLTDKTAGGDDEADGLTNLREYAFGTDPTVNFTGPMVYVVGGNVTKAGQPPLPVEEGGTYYAVFGRRKDYVAAGLTYTVQFSADLEAANWFNSAVVPTLVTGDPSAGDIEAVRVPFPGLIPTDSGPQKATFFRVEVSLAP